MLTNKLFEAVVGEAKVCGTGQPVVITGDFNVEPDVIPVIAKALQYGHLVDLETAFSAGRGKAPSPTCRFDLDGAPGTRRDFFLACPNALAASVDCQVLVDRWFRPHFAVCAHFGLGAWSAEVQVVRSTSPLAPACWMDYPDRSRYSLSKPVQEVWGVYLDMLQFVPVDVRQQLHRACLEEPNVNAAWGIWCTAAENGLLYAYKAAGGPCPQGDPPFLGRGKAVFRTKLIGGRAPGRVHRPARTDAVDCANCLSFVNSSLSPVVLFRRRLSSVGDVLKGISKNGFSTARWQALMLRWAAVCRQGPTGPVTSLDPWRDWLPPDLHGFYAWVFDTLKVLDRFITQVASARRDAAILSWKRWLHEDLSSRPYKWLRPDLVPPAPYLVCDHRQTPGGSGILVQPSLIDAQFRKAWMPFFRRGERDPVTPHGFLDFIGDFLEQAAFIDMPVLTGEDSHSAVLAKKSTSGGLDGWSWNELKALPLSWYVGLAWVLRLVEDTGVWPEGLLDAYIMMIPKTDGDSTPLRSASFMCFTCYL